MSIVESALQRLKGTRGGEPERRAPAPQSLGATLGPRPMARIPVPVHWPANVAPAEFNEARLSAAGLRPSEASALRMRDEYRAIRREVVAASQERIAANGPTVGPIAAVTSAAPGDGKSYTALNLALSIAGQGVYDVLLVDADFVKRTITRACNLADRPGMADLLAHPGVSFQEYAYPAPTGRLRILPTGRADSSQDLFAPARIAALFDSIRSTMAEHIVIVDTPPILVSSDTPVMLDAAGQVLLVVRAGVSLQDAVREAVGRIRKTLPVGVILNDWLPLLPTERQTYGSYDEYAR